LEKQHIQVILNNVGVSKSNKITEKYALNDFADAGGNEKIHSIQQISKLFITYLL